MLVNLLALFDFSITPNTFQGFALLCFALLVSIWGCQLLKLKRHLFQQRCPRTHTTFLTFKLVHVVVNGKVGFRFLVSACGIINQD
jgi:hypothetical protein